MDTYVKQGYPNGSFIKETDVAYTKGQVVKLGTAEDQVELATLVSEKGFGVTLDDVDAGENKGGVGIAQSGIVDLQISGTVAVGAFLTPTTGSKGLATTTATDYVFAQALSAGTDETIKVRLLPFATPYSNV